ncbi:MAG: DbpA RNA binding domain-containing protein [Gemmatimonadota bacterium]|nr:DbpA RNA binding domain-containing protein [Gemmatimonadota bacterium]
MTSFEELNIEDEVVEALAAEGIEIPTQFQAAAVPVIAKGRDLMGRAGPGAGTMIGYAAGLLSRLEGGAGSPVVIVLCTGVRQSTELARSLAAIAEACGMRVAALSPQWNLPQRADFLFVPAEEIGALFDGSVALTALKAVVIHDGDGLLRTTPRDRLDSLFNEWPPDTQRIICGQPFGSDLATFAAGHTKRAVTVPPMAAEGRGKRSGPKRGTLTLHVVDGTRDETALDAVVQLLEEPVRHVVVHALSSDQAADVGDFLSLHGFHCGPVGDPDVPVWLAVDGEPMPEFSATHGSVASLSYSVPSSSDAMLQRHPDRGPAAVVSEIRELAHLKVVAREAGFDVKRLRPPRPIRVSSRIDELGDRLGELVTSPSLTPYYLLVEALASRFTPSEIAAAALYQLDEGPTAAKQPPKPDTASWVRLFVTAGSQDEVGARELLGAITGESNIAGNRVGRIDVREKHSLVEVRQEDAKRVIDALNGTTLGGRAIRVDYDRAHERKSAPKPGPRRKPVKS